MKVLTVFGTRPEAIKLAPVLAEFDRRPARFESTVCVTAQHRDLLDGVLRVFGITPQFDLDLMRPNQTLEILTGEAIRGIAGVLAETRPDAVLVQGDTTTCFAAALAAYYAKVPVGHVEAGLRTGNIYSPFPEEVNRRLVDSIASYLYPPTALARDNLLREGVPEESILVTGNTIVDAMLWARDRARQIPPPLGLDLAGRRLVLVTAHRRESFGEGIADICRAVRSVADAVGDVVIVFPIHPNPNVRGPASQLLGGHNRIVLTDPQGYLEFAWLVANATLVMSDSGGVQEEASSLGVPLLVMRETTERPEALSTGTARLVGTSAEAIGRAAIEALGSPPRQSDHNLAAGPFGDGKASVRIADHLERVATR